MANGLTREFDQEQLQKVWNYFTESIAKQYPNFYSTLTHRKPKLKDDFIIELTVDNKVQEVNVRERKAELLEFLREELDNSKINLITVIAENNGNGRPSYPDEKYKAMAEKNPKLKDFKEKLDLEIDF